MNFRRITTMAGLFSALILLTVLLGSRTPAEAIGSLYDLWWFVLLLWLAS